MALQLLQILRISAVVGQLDVEPRALLAEGKILRAVHGEGEDALVAGEDGRGAVALVHVEIDDHRAIDEPLALQHPRRDGEVVEHAETVTVVGEGVVRAAGEVAAEAVAQRLAGGGHGAEDAGARAGDQPFAPGKAQPPQRRAVEGAREDGVEIVGRVGEEQRGAIHQPRLLQLVRGQHPFLEQPLAQQLVLGHGEAVPRRQRDLEVVAVERAHRPAG